MLINLIKKNLAALILFFATSPGRRYPRKELKEWTKMNNIPLDNSLKELVNLKILKKIKGIYCLDVENKIVKQFLPEIRDEFAGIPFEIQRIVVEFLSEILKISSIKSVILFGSYSKLIFTEHSDIDFAIITEKEDYEAKKKINLLADKVSNKYKKEVHVNFLEEKELKHKKDPLIKEIKQNGRILL